MDRHERPYKCSEPGCEERLGFVSTGDYLRHQREIHDNGGKPRYSELCPSTQCRRHVSEPFARAENLREHIRRMHKSEANSYLELVGTVLPDPGISKDPSVQAREDGSPDTCLSRDNLLQMEADSLRDRIVEQDRRIQELEQMKIELEAMSHGAEN